MPWGEGINSYKSIMQGELHEQDLPDRGLWHKSWSLCWFWAR